MDSEPQARLNEFFNHLISGRRRAAARLVESALTVDTPAEHVLADLCWPVLEQIESLRRHDRISELAYHYATRLLQQCVARLETSLPQRPTERSVAMVGSGAGATEELAAQMTAALLEARGYEVYFCGGGVPADQIIAQLAQIDARTLVVFGMAPQTVPTTRLLISRLHERGAWPRLQVVLGGTVFNRTDAMAELLGADLWAPDPATLVSELEHHPDRRVPEHRRTTPGPNRILSQPKLDPKSQPPHSPQPPRQSRPQSPSRPAPEQGAN